MKKEAIELLERFCESRLGRPLNTARPVPLSGDEAVEALWPMNAMYRPYLDRIRSIRYEPAFEEQADEAISSFAFNPSPYAWHDVAPGAWRVLLERHMQAISMAVLAEARGDRISLIPDGLGREHWTGFVLLFLLWGMELPFPVVDRSTIELPEGDPPKSMRTH